MGVHRLATLLQAVEEWSARAVSPTTAWLQHLAFPLPDPLAPPLPEPCLQAPLVEPAAVLLIDALSFEGVLMARALRGNNQCEAPFLMNGCHSLVFDVTAHIIRSLRAAGVEPVFVRDAEAVAPADTRSLKAHAVLERVRQRARTMYDVEYYCGEKALRPDAARQVQRTERNKSEVYTAAERIWGAPQLSIATCRSASVAASRKAAEVDAVTALARAAEAPEALHSEKIRSVLSSYPNRGTSVVRDAVCAYACLEVTAPGEADDFLAALFVSEEVRRAAGVPTACGVLAIASNDSDFAMFSGVRWLPLWSLYTACLAQDALHPAPLMAGVIHPLYFHILDADDVASLLRIPPRLLPDVAFLASNDYSRPWMRPLDQPLRNVEALGDDDLLRSVVDLLSTLPLPPGDDATTQAAHRMLTYIHARLEGGATAAEARRALEEGGALEVAFNFSASHVLGVDEPWPHTIAHWIVENVCICTTPRMDSASLTCASCSRAHSLEHHASIAPLLILRPHLAAALMYSRSYYSLAPYLDPARAWYMPSSAADECVQAEHTTLCSLVQDAARTGRALADVAQQTEAEADLATLNMLAIHAGELSSTTSTLLLQSPLAGPCAWKFEALRNSLRLPSSELLLAPYQSVLLTWQAPQTLLAEGRVAQQVTLVASEKELDLDTASHAAVAQLTWRASHHCTRPPTPTAQYCWACVPEVQAKALPLVERAILFARAVTCPLWSWDAQWSIRLQNAAPSTVCMRAQSTWLRSPALPMRTLLWDMPFDEVRASLASNPAQTADVRAALERCGWLPRPADACTAAPSALSESLASARTCAANAVRMLLGVASRYQEGVRSAPTLVEARAWLSAANHLPQLPQLALLVAVTAMCCAAHENAAQGSRACASSQIASATAELTRTWFKLYPDVQCITVGTWYTEFAFQAAHFAKSLGLMADTECRKVVSPERELAHMIMQRHLVASAVELTDAEAFAAVAPHAWEPFSIRHLFDGLLLRAAWAAAAAAPAPAALHPTVDALVHPDSGDLNAYALLPASVCSAMASFGAPARAAFNDMWAQISASFDMTLVVRQWCRPLVEADVQSDVPVAPALPALLAVPGPASEATATEAGDSDADDLLRDVAAVSSGVDEFALAEEPYLLGRTAADMPDAEELAAELAGLELADEALAPELIPAADVNALPVLQHRLAVLRLLSARTVAVIKGDTGSGKTTNVPQFILDCYSSLERASIIPAARLLEQPEHSVIPGIKSLNGVSIPVAFAVGCTPSKPKIVVSQPRRVAALSLSKFVSQCREVREGTEVGYRIGMHKNASDKTQLTFVTTGWLLQVLVVRLNEHMAACKAAWDAALSSSTGSGIPAPTPECAIGFTHLMLDEVHERSVHVDVVALLLKVLLRFFAASVVQRVVWARVQSPAVAAAMASGARALPLPTAAERRAWLNDCAEQYLRRPRVLLMSATFAAEAFEQYYEMFAEELFSSVNVALSTHTAAQLRHLMLPSWEVKVDIPAGLRIPAHEHLFMRMMSEDAPDSVHVGGKRYEVVDHFLEDIADDMAGESRAVYDDVRQLRSIFDGVVARQTRSRGTTDASQPAPNKGLRERQLRVAARLVPRIARPGMGDTILVFVQGIADMDTFLTALREVLPPGSFTQPVVHTSSGAPDAVDVDAEYDEEVEASASGHGGGADGRSAWTAPDYSAAAAGAAVPQYDLLMMHSSFSMDDVMRAFDSHSAQMRTRVVVATNMAESSVTLPNVTAVIDTGLAKQWSYVKSLQTSVLGPSWISQASATQRAGRAGRVCCGDAYRLYTRAFCEGVMPRYSTPEMLLLDMDSVVLQVKLLGLLSATGDDDTTTELRESVTAVLASCIDMPEVSQIKSSLSRLAACGALESDDDCAPVTPFGRLAHSMAVDVHGSLLIVAGMTLGLLPDAIVLAAAAAGMLLQTNLPYDAAPREFDGMTKRSTMSKLVLGSVLPLNMAASSMPDHNSRFIASDLIATRNAYIAWLALPPRSRPSWCFAHGIGGARMSQMHSTAREVASRLRQLFPHLAPALDVFFPRGATRVEEDHASFVAAAPAGPATAVGPRSAATRAFAPGSAYADMSTSFSQDVDALRMLLLMAFSDNLLEVSIKPTPFEKGGTPDPARQVHTLSTNLMSAPLDWVDSLGQRSATSIDVYDGELVHAMEAAGVHPRNVERLHGTSGKKGDIVTITFKPDLRSVTQAVADNVVESAFKLEAESRVRFHYCPEPARKCLALCGHTAHEGTSAAAPPRGSDVDALQWAYGLPSYAQLLLMARRDFKGHCILPSASQFTPMVALPGTRLVSSATPKLLATRAHGDIGVTHLDGAFETGSLLPYALPLQCDSSPRGIEARPVCKPLKCLGITAKVTVIRSAEGDRLRGRFSGSSLLWRSTRTTALALLLAPSDVTAHLTWVQTAHGWVATDMSYSSNASAPVMLANINVALSDLALVRTCRARLSQVSARLLDGMGSSTAAPQRASVSAGVSAHAPAVQPLQGAISGLQAGMMDLLADSDEFLETRGEEASRAAASSRVRKCRTTITIIRASSAVFVAELEHTRSAEAIALGMPSLDAFTEAEPRLPAVPEVAPTSVRGARTMKENKKSVALTPTAAIHKSAGAKAIGAAAAAPRVQGVQKMTIEPPPVRDAPKPAKAASAAKTKAPAMVSPAAPGAAGPLVPSRLSRKGAAAAVATVPTTTEATKPKSKVAKGAGVGTEFGGAAAPSAAAPTSSTALATVAPTGKKGKSGKGGRPAPAPASAPAASPASASAPMIVLVPVLMPARASAPTDSVLPSAKVLAAKGGKKKSKTEETRRLLVDEMMPTLEALGAMHRGALLAVPPAPAAGAVPAPPSVPTSKSTKPKKAVTGTAATGAGTAGTVTAGAGASSSPAHPVPSKKPKKIAGAAGGGTASGAGGTVGGVASAPPTPAAAPAAVAPVRAPLVSVAAPPSALLAPSEVRRAPTAASRRRKPTK